MEDYSSQKLDGWDSQANLEFRDSGPVPHEPQHCGTAFYGRLTAI